ncbi:MULTISPECIES: AraC family transcriptional regulator [unclassified Mesorhizobium]|uniref:AraC family transcriptional regulator n=1 Tax=unclassified Mesorhizobium TaxID=325217 RepID=UPI001093AC86|nr:MULTISPECIES: AraC family transcriptional regulator [unclassified Mesorhizobium]TGT90752.1 AraC family transcriptional regulator [Mesorhizobium sp. M8A.F.Ca.ET.161.01.1.1]TGV43968.1 AraC family transcriptional regulator [Mesorhizobium sp. M8A.F.Ca.ET.142.01.1.1]
MRPVQTMGGERAGQCMLRVHFVISGECWLRPQGRPPLKLVKGDAALLPGGASHIVSDHPSRRARPLSDFPREEIGDHIYRLKIGQAALSAVMVCCGVDFAEPVMHPLRTLMPPALVVHAAKGMDPMLPMLLDAMADEIAEQRMGSATVLTRLGDVLITRLLRSWVEASCDDATQGWSAAIRDARIGQALAAIHREPGRPWSVEALAGVAGASRSTFSERFTALLGLSPGQYLTRWRMRRAAAWLQTERLSVAQVADRLGYESEAAFSRAFKRVVGSPPSALRRKSTATRPRP